MSRHHYEGRRLLIAEDDRPIAELVEIRLAVLGFNTRVAHDGLDALSRVREFQPEAMVLDINMPRMDGFSLMGQLGPEVMRRLPTLVLTARHQLEDVKRAMALGARDYLTKPFDEGVLKRRVFRLFGPATARKKSAGPDTGGDMGGSAEVLL